MNILEALEVALPDLPTTTAQRRFPKLDPRVISREHIEQGIRVVLAKMPGSDVYLRFTPEHWQLLQLFNGGRSYKEIADLILIQTNIAFTEEDVREFAAGLEGQGDLFYKTRWKKTLRSGKKRVLSARNGGDFMSLT